MAVPVFVQHFTQDINKPIQTRQGGGLTFTTNNLSNEISISLYDDGTPVAFTGTVSGAVIRSDGATVAVESGTLSGNTASIVLPEACFAVEGPIIVNILVSDSSEVSSVLLRAIYTVVSSETETAVDPGNIIPNIGTLIDNIETAVASVPADYSDLLDTIADTFSSSTAYAAGAYVWYDGTLYRFTAAHAAGSWSGTDASAVVLANDLADLKSRVENIENDVYKSITSKNLIDPDEVSVGRLESNGTINTVMTNYSTSDYILLESGKTYIMARESLTSAGTAMITGYAGYGLYDTSKTWIANSRVWADHSDTANPPTWIITPTNDCYIRVCCNKNYYSTDTTGKIILQEGNMLDGYASYFDPYQVISVIKSDDIVQSHGQNENKIMSQKAVTDYVDDCIETAIPEKMDEVVDVFYTQIGKNKYNATACSPQNGYYYNASNSGASEAANAYAITGKIPCEAQKTYTFSAGGVTVSKAFYYSGETGATYIGASSSGSTGTPLTFTTPENCTFVGINLFGASHTTDQYNAAIAAGQLEEGAIPTAYESYSETIMLPSANVQNGDVLTGVSSVLGNQSQINLYNKSFAVDGRYYNQGVEVSAAGWAITGKIPVQPNTQYNISRDPDSPIPMAGAVYEFDENGTFLRTASLGNYVYNYLMSFATESDVHYVAVNLHLDNHTTQDFEDTIDTLMLCYGTLRPITYTSYNAEMVLDHRKFDNAYRENVDCFKDKRWLATGTSITWYDGKKYQAGVNTDEICRGYVGNVSRRKGMLVTNDGISGATLGDVSESSLINRYTTLDWAGSDIATIEFGVNDFGHAVAIGTAEDAAGTTTFAACLKTIIEYALAQNPKLCLVICTEPDVRGSTPNSGGHYLYEYTDVTLAIAKQYRLPVCDWFYHSGIDALNKGDATKDWMTCDGTHPNDAGHMRMGAMLNQVFDSLIC